MDWQKAKDVAQKIASDPRRIQSLVNQAFTKTQNNPSFMQDMRKDLRLLLRMVKSQAKGIYQLPWSSVLIGVAAIIYFVNPMDLIPDFIVGPGLFDDAALLTLTFRTLRKELDAFATWESARGQNHQSTEADYGA